MILDVRPASLQQECLVPPVEESAAHPDETEQSQAAADVGATAVASVQATEARSSKPARTRTKVVRDPAEVYLDAVSQFPLLNGSEEEAALAKQIELGWFAEDLLSLRDPEVVKDAPEIDEEIAARAKLLAEDQLLRGLIRRATVLQVSRKPQVEQRKKVNADELPTDAELGRRGKLRNAPFEPEAETQAGRQQAIERLVKLAESFEADEIAELKELVEQGDKAFKRFVEGNLLLVAHFAKKRQHKAPLLDLIQEGNAGLIRAIEKFDYATGYKFSTYGAWWIRQSLTQAISDNAPGGAINRYTQERIDSVRKAESDLTAELRRLPTMEEITDRLNQRWGKRTHKDKIAFFTATSVQQLIDLDTGPKSLDAGLDEGDSSTLSLHNYLSEQTIVEVEDAILAQVVQKEVTRVVGNLPEDEAKAMRMLFGMPPYNRSHTRAEVYKELQISDKTGKKLLEDIYEQLAASPRLRALTA